MSSTDPELRGAEAAGGGGENTGAGVAPIVRSDGIAIATDEVEDIFLDLQAYLFRFNTNPVQWDHRGVVRVKLIKLRDTGKVQLVIREAMTLRILASILVTPSIVIKEYEMHDMTCIWHAVGFADEDGEAKQEEVFAIRFGSVEKSKFFKVMIDLIALVLG